MAGLKKSDIEHVAALAKLKLTSEETSKFVNQLSEVLNFIGQLSEVDTENVLPTSQTTGLTNVKRIDEVKPGLTRDEALSGTDKTHNGYFVVPGILEERTDK